MRKGAFTEDQIVAALQLAKSGGNVDDICRRLGMTRTTFYLWKAKYGGLGSDDARRLKLLEDENRHLEGAHTHASRVRHAERAETYLTGFGMCRWLGGHLNWFTASYGGV
jgi:putative transposase